MPAFANYSNTLENYVTINSSNGPEGGYDSNLANLYSDGYTSVTSLTYNAENHSVYQSTTGWELNNIVEGANEHTNAATYKNYRRRISKKGFVSFTHYSNPQGFTSNSGNLTRPKFPPSTEYAPALPDNIVTNSSLFQYNRKVLGITIDIRGVYEISVVRKVRDKYQTLQKNGFPEPLPYKNSIFICIFKQDTLITDIIDYFINNRGTLYRGEFPYYEQFKYAPQSGNYCKTYLKQGDIVCVYTIKNLSEVIFSGNWLSEGDSGSITNFSTTLYGFGNLTNQTYGFTNT
jgi:hypothetical protein